MPVTPHLARRPDIQSLRALAIALVVASHAGVPWLQGGFVGVDVFFVLSGYLISGLIITEIERTGRLDLIAFYARRMRRLFPTLAVVLLVTGYLAWNCLGLAQQRFDADAASAATLWMSNFFFASRVQGYFTALAQSNIYMHTWSLSVEEQFYFLWPAMLMLFFGYWKWQSRRFSRKGLAQGLLFMGALSLALCVYWARSDADLGFYLMPGRVWEFTTGALVFLLRDHCDRADVAVVGALRGRSLLNGLGLALVTLSAVFYTGALHYPGVWALTPVTGTALVLLDAPERAPRSPVSAMLLNAPAVLLLGDMSYSLYLWHWPLLVLGRSVLGANAWVNLLALALSVALAWSTTVLLERPLLRSGLRRKHAVFAGALLSAGALTLSAHAWSGEIDAMEQSPAQMAIRGAELDLPSLYNRLDCDTWTRSSAAHECVFGPAHARHTIVMLGDSVLAQWFPAVRKIYLSRPGWRLVVLTKSACPAVNEPIYYDRIHAIYTVCSDWRAKAIHAIVALHPDIVLMGSTIYGFTDAQWIDGTRSVLRSLGRAAGEVLIMAPTPELGFNGLDCLSANAAWPAWLPEARQCINARSVADADRVQKLLERASTPFANVRVIDMQSSVCPGGVCRARLRGRIVYRDAMHLTGTFVRSLAPELQRSIGEAQARVSRNETSVTALVAP